MQEKTIENYSIPQATSLLGDALFPAPPSERLLAKYDSIKLVFEKSPTADNMIWYGRFTAYSGDYLESIEIYKKGAQQFPDDPRFFRHMGHRYITIRQFDDAINVLEKAAIMIEGTENEIEPDGAPNAQNIPVSSLHGNIWYHLGLAYYLNQDFENALPAYQNCLSSFNNDDNVVSATHWLYMINRRLGQQKDAENVLEPIQKEMNVIENFAYQNIGLFYKGLLREDQLDVDNDAVSYAIGNWYYYNGNKEKAKIIYESILSKSSWNLFGYIAAEADYVYLFANER